MGIIHRSTTSIKDYDDIWKYIATQGGFTAADGLLESLEATALMLSNHPRAGTERPELGSRLRSFPVGNYIIFYRPKRDGIELTRVLHGSRNLLRIFKR
jgi:toxin ParE1/3/4